MIFRSKAISTRRNGGSSSCSGSQKWIENQVSIKRIHTDKAEGEFKRVGCAPLTAKTDRTTPDLFLLSQSRYLKTKDFSPPKSKHLLDVLIYQSQK